MIEELTSKLRELGATRVKSLRERDCTLLVGEFSNEVFIISVSRGRFTGNYVVKVVPASRVSEWSCIDVEYSPYGLYVLGSDVDDIVGRVSVKLRALLNVDFTKSSP